uniref:Putative Co/Zn/Cd efflux system component protein n=1 Tax=Magnetococcus massalia (strain MO-1) TaxID=451514 RepID=A0A1S7LFV6_MAGMO|nr:putative Co/Zn/Cd efflux system component protein [Candidatus Magnetococcus massalia]
MHSQTLDKWQHPHAFHLENSQGEQRTFWVVLFTALMMGVEIVAGTLYGSMALLADGWHMGTHVAALGITLFAYRFSRRHASNPQFSFGTGKVNALGGFASAIALIIVALLMAVESIKRLIQPETIRYDEALLVAVVGLLVNLVSAWLLHGGAEDHHHHDHGDGHAHGHAHGHSHGHDHNLRAAYLHVIADALTSITAIVALLLGRFYGWVWMDALMGIVGGAVITVWGVGLLKQTSHMLLDRTTEGELPDQITQAIEGDADNRISDLHLWQVGPGRHALILSIVTHHAREPDHYRRLLADIPGLDHITIEVHPCEGEKCLPIDS